MTLVRALDVFNIRLVKLETNFWSKCAQSIETRRQWQGSKRAA